MPFDDPTLLATAPRGPYRAVGTARSSSCSSTTSCSLFSERPIEQFRETIALRYEQGPGPGADRSCRFFCLRTSAQGLRLNFFFDGMGAQLQMIQEAELNLELLHYRTDS